MLIDDFVMPRVSKSCAINPAKSAALHTYVRACTHCCAWGKVDPDSPGSRVMLHPWSSNVSLIPTTIWSVRSGARFRRVLRLNRVSRLKLFDFLRPGVLRRVRQWKPALQLFQMLFGEECAPVNGQATAAGQIDLQVRHVVFAMRGAARCCCRCE
ncbi:MAG: hypothetical protein ABI178_02130 [Rhodanobacter sp.]